MFKNSKYVLSSFILIFLVLLSLPSFAVDTEQTGLTYRTLRGWNAHLDEVKLEGAIQKGCEPFYQLAKGKVKGSVMLFHGYSACPQQYVELASLLSEMGYNTFVPLLPGHGKLPVRTENEFIDQTAGLPDEKSAGIYKNFATTISAILQDEPGTKVAGGLSLGGVMAARAMLDHPDIYDRGFILAPFFNAAGIFGGLLPTVGKLIPDLRISWGERCENERKHGRGGYCNFRVTNIAAIRAFGQDTLKEVNKIKKPMQVSGVEKDPSASNREIGEAKRKLSDSHGCFFAEGASHSMLSRYDNIDKDMFWLNSLLQQLTRYIDTGRRFDQVGKSEYGMKRCRSY